MDEFKKKVADLLPLIKYIDDTINNTDISNEKRKEYGEILEKTGNIIMYCENVGIICNMNWEMNEYD